MSIGPPVTLPRKFSAEVTAALDGLRASFRILRRKQLVAVPPTDAEEVPDGDPLPNHILDARRKAAAALAAISELPDPSAQAPQRCFSSMNAHTWTSPVYAENLNPIVVVMKSAHDGERSDHTSSLNRARDGRILIQGQVRPRLIIVPSVKFQNSAQMCLNAARS
jgi:hypothetical protein